MRTHPATPAEVYSWLTVLHQHGHLHRVQSGLNNTWTVQRTPHARPWTLHHPVLAMDWIEELVREIRQQDPETHQ
ncbi:hypothetical protein OIC43_03645 [Streptomyces sp. NBC_00825]|uniref:hypothetical protein n=1 Tax=unclassified Streptomyces TaxID=2593676 RepID=UPI002ED44538|nr:hypothetical protein OG832_40070 [Streptomyces sp. NBC_00826]WTH88222.1 hypothetical protein OIC43_03645 [Streptomyces sp. NBC_00825]WTH96950.1 hypothetical protein OHA23_03645 [Streptomyces sp. NBC_00822]